MIPPDKRGTLWECKEETKCVGRTLYEKQNEQVNKQQNMLSNKGKGDISRPSIAPKQPTYTTKAPKK